MTLGFPVSLRNTRLDAISALVDAGTTGGFIRIYNGVRPATGGAATTLLAELQFGTTAFAAAAAGTLSANAITSDPAANASGTASWFRVVDDTGAFVMDGDVGTSGTDMVVATTTVTAGIEFAVSQFDITEGNA